MSEQKILSRLQVAQLSAMAESFSLLADVLKDPKNLKNFVKELQGVDEVLKQKDEILSAKSRAEEISALNAIDIERIEKFEASETERLKDLDKREQLIVAGEARIVAIEGKLEKQEKENKDLAVKLDSKISEQEAMTRQAEEALKKYNAGIEENEKIKAQLKAKLELATDKL